jgi:hypothetical protein
MFTLNAIESSMALIIFDSTKAGFIPTFALHVCLYRPVQAFALTF